MLDWLQPGKFTPRPVTIVEDHVYHLSEMLRTIEGYSPELLSNLTVVCLDRDGPDTDAAVEDWLQGYPALQIASRVKDGKFFRKTSRLHILGIETFESQPAFCRLLSQFIRPDGLLLQDIELETLEFIPPDRWWESTMLATTVRGIHGKRPPRCGFISNKRGYEATFGAELLAAGHDPRDVISKYDLAEIAVPFLSKFLQEQFPYQLKMKTKGKRSSVRLVNSHAEQELVEGNLDLVIWPPKDGAVEIGGLGIQAGKKDRLNLSVQSDEAETWQQLVCSTLDSGPGVSVQARR